MRTQLITLTGLVLALVVMWRAGPGQRVRAAGAFTVVWLLVTAWNLRTGLSHGYTFREELPIHVVIFTLPVATIWALAAWRDR